MFWHCDPVHLVVKTIAFAHSVGVIGGAERVTLNAIEALTGKFGALLIAPREGQLLKVAAEREADTVALDLACYDTMRPLGTVRMLAAARRVLKQNVSILHAGDIVAFRGLAGICRRLEIPTVCHVHYPYPESFLRWVFRRGRQPTAFVFCSEELRTSIGSLLSELCPDSRQEVIHNGVNTALFVPFQANRFEDGGLPRVGIVANLQQRKGHEDFLEMAALLKARGYRARYDVIGGDILQEPRRPNLERLCKRLGLADDVVFHGQIESVVAALSQLDVVVCASHEEAFPISMLEAMACQKAIVSTDVNGITEALTHELNALLVNPHDPEALATSTARLLDDRALAENLAEAARLTVLEHFSERAFGSKVLALYRGLLGEGACAQV